MQIQISWLLQKPTDLDLHCLQRQARSGFSRTRVKTPCPLLIFSWSDYLIQTVAINSHTYWQAVQILISWLLQKPTDLDLHCLQMQGISKFSRTWVICIIQQYYSKKLILVLPKPTILQQLVIYLLSHIWSFMAQLTLLRSCAGQLTYSHFSWASSIL